MQHARDATTGRGAAWDVGDGFDGPLAAGVDDGDEKVMTDLNELYQSTSIDPHAGRVVLHRDGTTTIDPNRRTDDREFSDEIDHLFGTRPSYIIIKKEQPHHRLILWLTLQGQRPREIATAVRMHVISIRSIQKQPWFQDAFTKLAKEMGKDAMQVRLQSEGPAALERTIELAVSGDSDAVKLAANKEILDRYLGKSVVKAEVKNSGQVDHVVYDAEALLQEQKRNAEILRSRGIATGSN